MKWMVMCSDCKVTFKVWCVEVVFNGRTVIFINMANRVNNAASPSFEVTFIGTLLKSESVLKDEIRSLAQELKETKKELAEAKASVETERALNAIQFDAYVDELTEAENKIECLESELRKNK